MQEHETTGSAELRTGRQKFPPHLKLAAATLWWSGGGRARCHNHLTLWPRVLRVSGLKLESSADKRGLGIVCRASTFKLRGRLLESP
jgi:hypothetical protein